MDTASFLLPGAVFLWLTCWLALRLRVPLMRVLRHPRAPVRRRLRLRLRVPPG